MKPAIGVRRRRLLAGVVGGGLLVASRPADRDPAVPGAVAAYLSRLSCPRTIGVACLAALPRQEASKQALADSLSSALLPSRWCRLSAAALGRRIMEESRRDFAKGRVVLVGGWMLSRTEARIYALAALVNRGVV